MKVEKEGYEFAKCEVWTVLGYAVSKRFVLNKQQVKRRSTEQNASERIGCLSWNTTSRQTITIIKWWMDMKATFKSDSGCNIWARIHIFFFWDIINTVRASVGVAKDIMS